MQMMTFADQDSDSPRSKTLPSAPSGGQLRHDGDGLALRDHPCDARDGVDLETVDRHALSSGIQAALRAVVLAEQQPSVVEHEIGACSEQDAR